MNGFSIYSLVLFLPLTLALPFDTVFQRGDEYESPWTYNRLHHEYVPSPSYTLTGTSPVTLYTATETGSTGTATSTIYITATLYPTATAILSRDFVSAGFLTAPSFPTAFPLSTGTASGPDSGLQTAGSPPSGYVEISQRLEGPRKRDDHHRYYPYVPFAASAAALTAPVATAPSAMLPTALAGSTLPLPTLAH